MSPTIGVVLLVALAIPWVLIVRASWLAFRPARLLVRGRYREAIEAATALSKSWLSIFASVRASSRYTIACARHFEGDLEGSIAALSELRRRESKLLAAPKMLGLSYAIDSLEAASLVLLERDPTRAIALVEGASDKTQEDLLLLACATHATGSLEDAERLFEAAGREPRGEETPEAQRAIFHALRGLYLTKARRPRDARSDLEIAAEAPSIYGQRARQALLGPSSSRPTNDAPSSSDVLEDEEPSSLAPQVVESSKDIT